MATTYGTSRDSARDNPLGRSRVYLAEEKQAVT
jgi:hypothetical protein